MISGHNFAVPVEGSPAPGALVILQDEFGDTFLALGAAIDQSPSVVVLAQLSGKEPPATPMPYASRMTFDGVFALTGTLSIEPTSALAMPINPSVAGLGALVVTQDGDHSVKCRVGSSIGHISLITGRRVTATRSDAAYIAWDIIRSEPHRRVVVYSIVATPLN
jgi:hypothetical protein